MNARRLSDFPFLSAHSPPMGVFGKGLCMSWFHVILGKDGLEKVPLLLIAGGIPWV